MSVLQSSKVGQLLLGLTLASWSVAALATQVDFSLAVGSSLALETGGQFQRAQLFAKPLWSASGDDWSAEFRGIAIANLNDNLVPQGLDTRAYSPLSKPLPAGESNYFDLTELWFQKELAKHWDVKLGKQVLNWGTLDELRVLDVINPQQFREFVFEDLSRTKLGLWGASAEGRLGDVSASLFVSSDHSGHESPPINGPFQFSAPELRFGFPARLGNSLPSTVQPTSENTYAARIKGELGGADYSVVAYSGPDYNPVGTLAFIRPTFAPTLVRSYGKRELYGVGASTALGAAVGRMEYAYSPNRQVNTLLFAGATPNLRTLLNDQQLLAFGMDYQLQGNLLLNAQWLLDHLADSPAGLIRSQTTHLTTLGFRKPLWNEKLALKGRWVFTDSGRDGLFQLTGDYSVSDSQNIRMGADVAYGREDQIFGQFRDRSRVKVEYEYQLN